MAGCLDCCQRRGAYRCGRSARISAEICHLIVVPSGHPAKPVEPCALPN